MGQGTLLCEHVLASKLQVLERIFPNVGCFSNPTQTRALFDFGPRRSWWPLRGCGDCCLGDHCDGHFADGQHRVGQFPRAGQTRSSTLSGAPERLVDTT